MARISQYATSLGIEVTPFEAIAAPPAGAIVYRIKDIFTTVNGSWEGGNVEPWARSAYLRPAGAADYFDDAGADHHIFGRVENPNASVITNLPIKFWTYQWAGNDTTQGVKPRSGWANIVMYSSSNFVRERGERGPWAWAVAGAYSDIVTGAGMPSNRHVSFFAVWQAVQYQPVKPPVDTSEVAKLRAEIDRLKSLNATLVSANATANAKIASMRAAIREACGKLGAL